MRIRSSVRVLLAATTLSLVVPAVAEDAHHPEAKVRAPARSDRPAAQPPSMDAMHRQMSEMQQQMERIRAAKEPAERQRLLDEHAAKMRAQMKSMHAMRSMAGQGPGRMNAMEQRMDMMQMMMEQMMERDEARHGK